MLIKETLELIRELRVERLEPFRALAFEEQEARRFVDELQIRYVFKFQERRVGHKYEVGLARSVSFELAKRHNPSSAFSTLFFIPVLRDCLLVSAYHDRLTEITSATKIQVVPSGGGGGDSLDVTLKIGTGYKLDKTPDGWAVKKLKKRPVILAESFLAARGWNFELFDIGSIK